MSEIRLRFPQHAQADIVLGPGLHGLAPRDGELLADAGEDAPVQMRVDRRGTWMTVAHGAPPVHVNGRRVRRLAMLRPGDAVHLGGMPVQLVAAAAVQRRVPEARAGEGRSGEGRTAEGTATRLVLRGVGGQHHGRCFELGRARTIGRLPDCDIRIDSPDFADRHARLEPHGDAIVLRALAPDGGSEVNGEAVRDALLGPGDQVVFDAHHRFVVEAPGRPPARTAAAEPADGAEAGAQAPLLARGEAMRIPWLLLAAVLIAACLAGLLLFGAA